MSILLIFFLLIGCGEGLDRFLNDSVASVTSSNNGEEEGQSYFVIGGYVYGLLGTGLVLQKNGADDLAIQGNGFFGFTVESDITEDYTITVKTQPSSPSQICTVNNATGTYNGQESITDITVICSTEAYTIGGSVSGLSGTLVIQNNGTDDLTINSDGNFTFNTPVADGGDYYVRVKTQPSGQTCTITNGTGTVNGSNITDIIINCS